MSDKKISKEKEKKEEVKKDKNDVIYFRLNPSSNLVWSSSDHHIFLSAMEATNKGVGVLYAKVEKEEHPQAYDEVVRAISYGILVKVSKKEYEKNKSSNVKMKVIDVNNGYANAGSINMKADSMLMNLDIDELVNEIANIYDPSLLATLIKKEENKKNKDKAIRSKVLKALNNQLNTIKANGMSDIVLEGESETIDIDLKDVIVKK